MKEATFSIVQFLKEVAKLGEDANNYRELLVEKEEKISVVEMKTTHIDIEEQRKFIYPEIDLEKIAQGTDKVRISYEVSKDLANKVKIYSRLARLHGLPALECPGLRPSAGAEALCPQGLTRSESVV